MKYLEGSFIRWEKFFPRAYCVGRYPFEREVFRNALAKRLRTSTTSNPATSHLSRDKSSVHRQTASLLPVHLLDQTSARQAGDFLRAPSPSGGSPFIAPARFRPLSEH